MTARDPRRSDQLRAFIDLLVGSLDDPADGAEIARRAFLSRYHFDRLVAAALGESPGVFRRRLLLERAAYQLASAPAPVTEIALDAGYASPDAFARAFRRLYAATPSAFRRAPRAFRVPSPNGVHFHPPAGLLVPGRTEGSEMMDPTDRMLEHDLWLTRRLLDRIATLPEAELDRDVRGREPMAYESDDPTIRAMLDRLVFTREVWIAAVAGRPSPRLDADRSLAGLRARLEASADEFRALVRRARERGEWDTAFVNALRTPPETATFGGMVAHVLTFQACRRGELLEVLRRYGIEDLGYGDPVDWERAVLDRDA